ncbi:HSP20-like chaperone [Dipodascopsis tothii]|uniref:HSP20-like chaperone n=1 Tax=Dipodascopsis tothii TaxID=44089 RepID=UPI0034CDD11C
MTLLTSDLVSLQRSLFDVMAADMAWALGTRPPASKAGWYTPAFDLSESAKDYVLEGEVPGVERDQLTVEFVGDRELRVEGRTQRQQADRAEPSTAVAAAGATTAAADTGVRLWAAERAVGQFARSFRLPRDADTARASASLQHGLLRVRVPKKPAPQPLRVKVAVE